MTNGCGNAGVADAVQLVAVAFDGGSSSIDVKVTKSQWQMSREVSLTQMLLEVLRMSKPS